VDGDNAEEARPTSTEKRGESVRKVPLEREYSRRCDRVGRGRLPAWMRRCCKPVARTSEKQP